MSSLVTQQLIDSTYIIAVIGFVLSLKWLSSPVSAKYGVLAGEIAAALAVGATLCNPELVQYKWILVALIIGAGVGIPLGLVHMTAVPQRTALSHAFGALSAAMIGIAEYYVAAPNLSKFSMAEIGLRGDYRFAYFHWQRDRSGKVTRNPATAPDHISRTKHR